ncbi:MAG: hypothetical protein EB012_04925, partial [Gammaproteobacteria bacterium]|nr:hypothetical protein [Gammaproteobacteria bacterium]
MKQPFSTFLAAGIGGAALGLSAEALALTDSERLERLEKTIERLENRLEATESENKRLKKEVASTSHHGAPQRGISASSLSGDPVGEPALAKLTTQPEFRALDTKVKLLERKLEVEKEVADNNRKSAAKVEAGPNGFKLGTPDGDWQLRLRGFLQADTETFLNDTLPAGTGIGWNPTLGPDGEPNPY